MSLQHPPHASGTSSGTMKQSRGPGPGKTAPRLFHDALLLDPAAAFAQADLLADPAPIHTLSQSSHPTQNGDSCRHEYFFKIGRSSIPGRDYRPQGGDHWEIQSMCRTCRLHMVLSVQYPFDCRRPCPNADYPLHHFQLVRSEQHSHYEFACSSPDCRALCTIAYQSSVISDDDIRILVDPKLLEARYQRAIALDTSRTGFMLATPVNSLWKLRRYLRDALLASDEVKKIPANNKRFLESFGPDTYDLLRFLGFTHQAASGQDAVWELPRLPEDRNSPKRILLENWEMELQALIVYFASKDEDLNPDPTYMWFDAKPEMERILSIQGYSKSAKAKDAAALDHPFYASLGAMRDFSDDLVAFAYERQTACDPENAPYYFDCLHDLANGRASETLTLKASLLESQGVVGHKAIDEAYAFFGIDPRSLPSDQSIADRFHSRLEDTGISARPALREKLKVLASARQSSLLSDAASDTIDTYPQALAWLGAEHNYPDDSILTLFAAKVADDSSNETLARRAVKVIADSRNSIALHSWLATGEMKDTGMTVDEACAHLKIQLKDVDETMLQLVFESARSDNPGTRTDQAIDTVMRAYHKPAEAPMHSPATWPVGLTSHGNTCYLNSLLQYYFTIKPLRDLVLNFEEHKFDLSTHGGKEERVGSRKVTPLEIRAYQKFVEDLKHLFDRMIRDVGPSVKPEADLVCRAFLKAEETEEQTALPSRAPSPPADHEIKQPEPQHAVTNNDLLAPLLQKETPGSASTVSMADVAMQEASNGPHEMPPSPPTTPHADKNMTDAASLLAPALPPRQLTTPMRQQTNLNKAEEAARQQQDVTEVMDEILFRLRCAIKPSGMDSREEQLDKLRDIFYMKISEKTLDDSGKESVREEYALNILLNIPNRPTDIYTALDEIFELQTIDHGDKKLKQYKTLQSLPPLLQINIPRITYDRNTGRGVKVDHKVHLEETLYMDRYFEWESSDIMTRREESWKWRQQLSVLQAQKDVISRNAATQLEGPAKLSLVSKYLRSLESHNADMESLGLSPVEFDISMTDDLDSMASTMQAQVKDIDEQIAALQKNISSTFDDHRQVKYRLHAVFFHRGGYGHGHYWTCINDFDNNVWRVYNDEKVDQLINVNDIYDAETWQQGTPTYAVYVRDDLREQYVQTVCRQPETATSKVEALDEVMQDQSDPVVVQADAQPRVEEVEITPDQQADSLKDVKW